MVSRIVRKYFIMGSQDCPSGQKPEAILQEAIEAGITVFQYREKGSGSLQGEDKIALGKALRQICRQANIPFIINNDVELIDLLDVDGIHVGQTDTKVGKIRQAYPDLMIGLSLSNENELQESDLRSIDYIGAGPVYATSSKPDATQAVGVEWIQSLRTLLPTIPIVGIGGITPENASQVIKAGADGVSVISAITKAKNIPAVVQAL